MNKRQKKKELKKEEKRLNIIKSKIKKGEYVSANERLKVDSTYRKKVGDIIQINVLDTLQDEFERLNTKISNALSNNKNLDFSSVESKIDMLAMGYGLEESYKYEEIVSNVLNKLIELEEKIDTVVRDKIEYEIDESITNGILDFSKITYI